MAHAADSTTLYIDLDGTLIFSDLLIESLLDLLKRQPCLILWLPFWLLGGKAYFKQQVARHCQLRSDLLPYNRALIESLQQEKKAGRRLVLISASNQSLVDQVASTIGLFDAAIGSTGTCNLSGIRKLSHIRELEGEAAFAYAGNAAVDLPIWRAAEQAIAVNCRAGVLRQLHRDHSRVSVRQDSPAGWLQPLIQALRPYQWLKNLLLFLPLLLAYRYPDPALWIQTGLGFICFSLCASAAYLLNDLLDLEADRQHPRKTQRPFAAGTLPALTGLLLSPAMMILALLLAWLALPRLFFLVLLCYLIITLLYSFLLKRLVLVDVIALAVLYTLRIIAGAAAIALIPSFWLLAFSMFAFFSLAVVKRHSELSSLRDIGLEHSIGRGYRAGDLDLLAIFGSTSSFMAVMVFALYINSTEIQSQYATPQVLWLICPLLFYLMSRIWLLAWRGELEDDPLIFALNDRISQLVVLLGVMLLYLAHFDWRALLT